ncbi:hypothetical protein B0H15DRAFT_1026342 [Mycena belliarum]|uniref:BTB domain-containing protein n=1 Tax=Mycena belliarum TaxID=1033014 RepID=A0AAD6TSV0_9AGAR|nr:hypothetical protein B0H15DRAFT_1026342 [Mycena belliae]
MSETASPTTRRRSPSPEQSLDSDIQPPARRRRLDSVDSKDWQLGSTGFLIEDPTFSAMDYRICFLQVENHLFQIHLHHLLSDETSVFRDMLLLPDGASAVQGFHRDTPISLTGDTLDEIRAFHASAYTSVKKLAKSFEIDDMEMLVRAGLFSHKYGMTTFCDFALVAIHKITAESSLTSCSRSTIHDLLRLTWLCGPDRYNARGTSEFDIREFGRQCYVDFFRRQPSAENLVEMIAIAEQFDIRQLVGQLYYIYLCRLTISDPGHTFDAGPVFFTFPQDLSDLHRARLLTGYWSLTQCWNHFAKTAPRLPVPCSPPPKGTLTIAYPAGLLSGRGLPVTMRFSP